jgi:glutamate-1-semialdehyde 2,1-aminomutase
MASAVTPATARYRRSQQQMERARRSLAGGVATAMRAAQRPVPLVIDHAEGSHLVDIDGNDYVDYVLGFGPMLLGHTPRAVIEAVKRQLERGFTYGAQHALEAEVAEGVVDAVPCAELVCFSSTGSEAVQAALRIARAATSRTKVIKFEGHYHGWLDPLSVSTPGLPAADPASPSPLEPVPATGGQAESADVLVARWNDADELAAVLGAHGDEVAAVIMEPVAANGGLIPPVRGYLERARELTAASGSLLIFDEVVTGFRLARGGAQEFFGVTPDLTILGKAIAGGMPLSAVAGRRDVMEVVADGRVRHVGTFNCAPPAAAAAAAALDIYREGSPELYTRLDRTATALAEGLAEAAAGAGVPLKVHQIGPLLQTFILDPEAPVNQYAETLASDATLFALFAERMLGRGVIVLPRGWWFLSTAHMHEDIELTLDSARAVFAELAEEGLTDGPGAD